MIFGKLGVNINKLILICVNDIILINDRGITNERSGKRKTFTRIHSVKI